MFIYGENPISAVPKDYKDYQIYYLRSATPTEENINSIGQWTEAERIEIIDRADVAVNLCKHIDEVSGLKNLSKLILHMRAKSYKQINVAAFMEKLVGLKTISFRGGDMTNEQMKEFEVKNEIPLNWRSKLVRQFILYQKQD